MMKRVVGVLPTGLRFSVRRDGRMATFRYEEDFTNRRLVARTAAVMRGHLPPEIRLAVTRQGKTVRLSGTVDYALIASMIASEFMAWTPMFEMSLRDLFVSTLVGTTRRQ